MIARLRLDSAPGTRETDDLGLFTLIKDSVLDLQSAQLQTYERPLKTLARLLRHAELDVANAALTANVDLDAFLAQNDKRQGGMVGSDHLDWPEDHEQVLGLTLLLIERFAETPDDLIQFAHRYFYTGRKIIGDIHAVVGQMIIPFVRDYKAYVTGRLTLAPRMPATASNKIFIVHGHDEGARESVARFLERLGFEAIILHERTNRGRTIIEKVEANSDVGFAVVLLTPDDDGSVKGGELLPRARQNVLLELGYFLGRLGRDRVCALMKGTVDIPSDFAGVVWEPIDASNGWKMALGRELEAAGYVVNWNKVMR